jgi:hypothetical protein
MVRIVPRLNRFGRAAGGAQEWSGSLGTSTQSVAVTSTWQRRHKNSQLSQERSACGTEMVGLLHKNSQFAHHRNGQDLHRNSHVGLFRAQK